ncbi:ABC transporter permease [Allopusillimonas ginsengisoli]|uniref:ABC transporter permease n=1 Tax=Allopusillimonas ginsengisoli TaxID=453575 RepID=UPI00101ED379|nr:ABC transporter permease [Allopusillimonas ginsengisoli]TEA71921.1 ABC transporter permease [Allopusillimonas ginsengisoli]
MLAYITRRILATIPVIVMVGVVVFAMLRLTTGDPAAIMAGDDASTEQLEQMRHSMGLDKPIYVQFALWLMQLLQGDLGVSLLSGTTVSGMISDRMGPSLALALGTITLTLAVAIPLGMLAAWKQGKLLDRAIMTFSVFGFSVPAFVVAYLLIYLFSINMGWLPVQGYKPLAEGVWSFAQRLVLPVMALSAIYVALIARITRSSIIEVMGEDFIRTARAKGATENAVLMRHALRNAASPILTVIGIGIASLISGVVVIETVFNLPGLGRLVVEAVLARDYPVIQGLVLLSSLVYVLINLAVDILYSVFDPRITY